MPNDEPDAMGLGVPPPPVVFFGPLVLGLLLNRKLPAPFLPHRSSRILGLPLLSSGLLLGGWFYRTMKRAGTPIIGEPFVPGRPTSSLVTDGPFRYTRNPGYLGLALLYAGIAVLRNALWAILLLPVVVYVIQREVIGREESYLERTFGEEYLAYKARVRRWV